ncbi:MAG: hypothetical protein HUJ70_06165 [Pseudobutyrivibrio sp.]|nr:hypothetical protein [Pseudobutyrivibrio sp.]
MTAILLGTYNGSAYLRELLDSLFAQTNQEFKLFETNGDRMEYEANVFAAQLSLPDEEILSYIEEGLDIQQIAGIMHTDVNLVALKNDTLIAQGYRFRRQDHTNTFLKFDGSAT